MLSACKLGPVRHKTAMAWNKCWALERFATTRALGLSARLRRLNNDGVPTLTRGCLAWHVLRATVSAIVRITRMVKRDVRYPAESELGWHKRSWQSAKANVSHAWG